MFPGILRRNKLKKVRETREIKVLFCHVAFPAEGVLLFKSSHYHWKRDAPRASHHEEHKPSRLSHRLQQQERGGTSHPSPVKRARIQQRAASSAEQRRDGDDLSLTHALQPHLSGQCVFTRGRAASSSSSGKSDLFKTDRFHLSSY